MSEDQSPVTDGPLENVLPTTPFPLCVACVHHDTGYTLNEYRVDMCRAKAELSPNLVTGRMEWQGKSFHCSDAREKTICGPTGLLFKKRYPWWAKDDMGWPIERITNRPAYLYWLRVLFQNIRKVTG